MIRRISSAVLCIAVLGGAAATAEAAFKAGNYKGKTDQGAKVSLKVVKSKKAVIKFSWAGADLACSDGQNRVMPGNTSPASQKFPLSKSGIFGFTATRRDGSGEFAVDGVIKNSKAQGTLAIEVKVNPETNSIDPAGSVTCEYEAAWKAKRQ